MLLAALLWSLGGLGIKLIPWGAMSIIGLRAVLAAGVFALYLYKTEKRVAIAWTGGNVLAGACLSATTMLFVFANKLTTAAAAILLQFTAPIFILMLSAVFLRKKPLKFEVITVLVTFGGMTLFFFGGLADGGLLGNVLAIVSGLSFAGVFFFNRMPGTDPRQSLLIGFLINAVIGLPFAFFEVTADPVAWAAVIGLGVVQVGLAYIFFSIGIVRTPPLQACLITAVEPVLNPLWVMVFVGQKPDLYTILGGAVILVSVVAGQIAQAVKEQKAL